MFAPGYAASKTAMNAMTLAIELEGTTLKVNVVSPGFTKANLNGYEGTESVEQGAAQASRAAWRRGGHALSDRAHGLAR